MGLKLFRNAGSAACMGMLLAASYGFSDVMFENFDDGNESVVGSYWYYYTDVAPACNGTSTVFGVTEDPVFSLSPDGVEGTSCGYMEFVLGDTAGMINSVQPFVAFENKTEGVYHDFTGTKKITFDIKADKKMKVKFNVITKEVTNSNYYNKKIDVTTAWQTVEILFEKDADLGLTQENWGASTKAVAFNPAQVAGFNWMVRYNENPTIGFSGTIYIDNVTLVGDLKVKMYDEIDTLLPTGSYSGKGLLSDFSGDVFEATVLKTGGSWYTYDDGTSKFTKGLDGDGMIAPDENGGVTGGGISMAYELGTKFLSGTDTVAPYCGVGFNILDGMNKPYDAVTDKATGLYFEYKSTGAYVDVEFEDNIITRPAGATWHIKLPPTEGEWVGAKILFSDLVLPKWAKSAATLRKNALLRINFKMSGAEHQEGTFAIDNVYLTDAELAMNSIRSKATKLANKGIFVKQHNNNINVNIGKQFNDAKVSLINPAGKVVALKSLDTKSRSCSIPMLNNASGVYLLRVTSSNGLIETAPIHIVR